VAAIKELLDRVMAGAVQPIQGTLEYGISQQVADGSGRTPAAR
jgi:hypothetical protein